MTTFSKPTLGFHVFSDTISPSGEGEPDADALLTSAFRSLRPQIDTYNHLDRGQDHGPYFAELIEFLVDDTRREVSEAIASGNTHPDVLETARLLNEKTVRVVINNAPRTEDHEANGDDFHVAVTKSGVEFYVSSLSHLRYIPDRIVSLYRVPNIGNGKFDGAREQFRSSIVKRVCENPESLTPVSPDLSPENSQHSDIIVAYHDRFGNLRLRSKDIEETRRKIAQATKPDGSTISLVVDNLTCDGAAPSDFWISLPVKIANSLSTVPPNELGIYENVADRGVSGDRKSGYFELVRRWTSGKKQKPSAYESFLNPLSGRSTVTLAIPAGGWTINEKHIQ